MSHEYSPFEAIEQKAGGGGDVLLRFTRNSYRRLNFAGSRGWREADRKSATNALLCLPGSFWTRECLSMRSPSSPSCRSKRSGRSPKNGPKSEQLVTMAGSVVGLKFTSQISPRPGSFDVIYKLNL